VGAPVVKRITAAKEVKNMAKKAKCDKCRIRWDIRIMDQTPLRELKCPRCAGPVTPIYFPCNYPLARGEPDLNLSKPAT